MNSTDLNRKVTAIPPSETLAISAKAKAFAAAGEDVCDFSAGEPDFDTPAHIKAAAVRALNEGQTHYGPAPGLAALRAAIAEKLQRENGLTYAPEQVVVGNGAKQALFDVIMAVCRPRDEVLIPSPYWLSYPVMVRAAGGRPVFIEGAEDRGFKITTAQLEAALTPKSKVLILNSPSNPTGLVYTGKELAALAELAAAKGLYIISDEIYEKIVYDGAQHVSVAGVSKAVFDRTITVNGFSKAYAMTGWRLGYFAAPAPIVKAATAFQSHTTSGPNTFAQFGAIEALRGPQDCVGEMAAEFARRRDYLYRRLSAIPGLSCVKPFGAFYMLPNIAASGLRSQAFVEAFLDKHKVALVPGAPFGADHAVRISYACSLENIRKGMDRLETFMASIRAG